MHPRIISMTVLALFLASGGCMSGRRGHGGGDDDDVVRGDDDDAVIGDGDGPVDEPCAGYDPIPQIVVARLSGSYAADGMDSVEVSGVADLTLTPGEFDYVIEGTLDLRDTGARPLMACEDGTGNAACYGGLSVTFCGGNGYFSYDLSMGNGSWSFYDSTTSAYGSGEVVMIE